MSVIPKEIYGNPNSPISIKVANGGGGPTGVIRELADAFLEHKSDRKDFNVAWIQSITIDSLEHVRYKRVDIGLTYEPLVELDYIKHGWAKHHSYIWRDHFWLVGPKEVFPQIVPLKKEANRAEILQVFSKIAEIGKTKEKPIFITRDDGSGTVVKELDLWKSANVELPAEKASQSTWYYRMPENSPRFPADCLQLASEWKCLTLVDRGTFLQNPKAQEEFVVYLYGGDEDEDLLLNPCHAVVSTETSSQNDLAVEFTDFMASGVCQKILSTFGASSSTNIWKLPYYTPAHKVKQ